MQAAGELQLDNACLRGDEGVGVALPRGSAPFTIEASIRIPVGCSKSGVKFSPHDNVAGYGVNTEANSTACQQACAKTAQAASGGPTWSPTTQAPTQAPTMDACAYFSFDESKSANNCHFSSATSKLVQAERTFTSGPVNCDHQKGTIVWWGTRGTTKHAAGVGLDRFGAVRAWCTNCGAALSSVKGEVGYELDDDNFHSVSVEYTGTYMEIKIDGIVVKTKMGVRTGLDTGAAQADTAFCIGQEGDGDSTIHKNFNYFRGTIRDLRVWRGARLSGAALSADC